MPRRRAAVPREPARRVLLLALAAAAIACDRAAPEESTATGTLEYRQTEVSSLIPARVLRVNPVEGDSVQVGDTLVVLTHSAVHSDVDARRARLAAAEAQLRDLLAGSRPAEVARAEAEVRGLSAEAELANREVERLQALVARGDVSVQQLEAAEATARVSAARLAAAQQALRLIVDGSRPERIAVARAEVRSAAVAVDAAIEAVSDLFLIAPASGLVLSRHVEPGEVVAAGRSCLTIGDVSNPYVRVFVGPEVLPLVAVGDTVEGTLDGLPGVRFKGRVASVSTRAEFTPRVAMTREERADLLYGVRVELTDSSGRLKAGLPITVHFPLRGAR